MTNLAYNGQVIEQRDSDNYVNLTQMCQAYGKRLNNWLRSNDTQAYIHVVAIETRIRASQLIEAKKGGDCFEQGSWGHPLIALHLAQWISPVFHLWCNQHIKTLMTEGATTIESNEHIVLSQSEPLQRDAIAYIQAAKLLEEIPDIGLRQLLRAKLLDELVSDFVRDRN
jgi:hypothetical protein